MKSAFFIIALALSTSAHALSVGDTSTYAVTVGGQVHEGILTITAINGDTYTAQSSTDGQVNPTPSTGSVAQMNQMAALVPNCALYGGKPEAVATAAGLISTCHITSSDSEIYVGDVPFAIVRMTKPGQDLLLKSFVRH